MNVDDYLDEASRRPWIYGGGEGGFRGHDCTLFPANWCHFLNGHDPARDLRETYSTREEAEAIIKRCNGYFGLMAARLVSIGWKSTEEATDGVIGIIHIGSKIQIPAIKRGNKWIASDPRRLVPIPETYHCSMMWKFYE